MRYQLLLSITWILTFALPPWGVNDLDYGFSHCQLNNTRSAVFYLPGNCENDGTIRIPSPVSDIPCFYKCPPGTHLDINMSTGLPICSPWAENTFSLNGVRIPGEVWDWTTILPNIATFCLNGTSLHIDDCIGWVTGEDSTYISTSSFKNGTGWVLMYMDYYTQLETSGKMTVKYKKDAKTFEKYVNGIFSIQVNDEERHVDKSLNMGVWQTQTINLFSGQNKITFIYIKNLDDDPNLAAVIDMLEIQGTTYAALECKSCFNSLAPPGSSSCSIWPPNTYFDLNQCVDCPDGFFSYEGSVGVDECLEQPECTEKDYSPSYGPCLNSNRQRTFSWNTPKFCNSKTGATLPTSSTSVSCVECNPGYYHKIVDLALGQSQWTACPDGAYMVENPGHEVSNEWVTCEAGSYAPKVQFYTTWSEETMDFENICIGDTHSQCKQNKGWQISEDDLTSNLASETQDLILSKVVEITDSVGVIQFEYSLEYMSESNCFLMLFVDGNSQLTFREDNTHAESIMVYVPPGERLLEWRWHYEPSSEAQAIIHSLSIKGTGGGGAVTCIPCKPGSISAEGYSTCIACPPGQTSDESRTLWLPCIDGTYNVHRGDDGCRKCPINTFSNSNHTACIGEPSPNFESDVFHLENITGVSKEEEGYIQGICTKKKLDLYCHNTFYGPIPGGEDFFYLSLLNPSAPHLPAYYNYDTDHNETYYAIGILDSKQFEINTDLSTTDSECEQKNGKVMINLGSRIESLNRTPVGLNVHYSHGSLCDLGNSTEYHYSTKIDLVWEKEEGYGWPVHLGFTNWEAEFIWKSRYACPVCREDQLTKIEGKCKDGERLISYQEADECTSNMTGKHVEECSVAYELIQIWQVLLGVGVLLFLLAMFLIIFCCFWRVKSQYQALATECDDNELELAELG